MAPRRPNGYSDSIETPPLKGTTMNILKNFEAVFVVALGVAVAACGTGSDSSMAAASAPQAMVATPSTMAVVTVSAKRMSAVEKQRSLEDERRLAKQGSAAGSRI
jgi:hypothetical protein